MVVHAMNSALVFVLLALFDASSIHSYISIAASHLGMLDVQCADMKLVMMEPNHKTVFGGHILKMDGSRCT